MLLTITRVDERYVVEYNGCIVYAAYSRQDALQWAEAYGSNYQ